ncbi:MAG: PD-(D/E)XK nuclease family protein [Planctomycetes bacterium]|nr:PD-(D/E)XK nuclease family protein [Planctomycetota bacterium]
MHTLHLRGQQVHDLYSLLGNNENNMTFSLAWALANSHAFLQNFIDELNLSSTRNLTFKIQLQEHSTKDKGYTDIEIHGDDLSLIIEAKKSRNLPSKGQLQRYRHRLSARPGSKRIVVVSDCGKEDAIRCLPPKVRGVPVSFVRWHRIVQMAERSANRSGNAEKKTLRQLAGYLRGIVRMKTEEDNWVFVVPIGNGNPRWSKLSWREFIEKRRVYLCPVGAGGYPHESPFYLGFRYDGKLQSIHHVDRYEITRDLHKYVPEIHPKKKWNWDHFVFFLGKPIRPGREVRSGPIRDTKLWAFIDTLLISRTVQQARSISAERERRLRKVISL